jgi:arginase
MAVVTVQLLGVPFNSSGTSTGVARGPAAMRAAGLLDALLAAGVATTDGGDVALVEASPDRDPVSGIIAPGALGAMIGSVAEAVRTCREGGAFPVVLGGDCPILIGCLAASSEDVGVLFVDGHEDAWPPHASPTGEAADMELGFLLGRTTELPPGLRSLIPQVDPRRITVFGARDEAELRDAGVSSIDEQIDVVRTDGMSATDIDGLGEDRVRRLDRLGRWWLHVDLDVLATSSLAAVDYPQPGGLDWPRLTALTRRALSSPNVVGWTVTIYNPDLDSDRTGAAAIVDYLAQTATEIRA